MNNAQHMANGAGMNAMAGMHGMSNGMMGMGGGGMGGMGGINPQALNMANMGAGKLNLVS